MKYVFKKILLAVGLFLTFTLPSINPTFALELDLTGHVLTLTAPVGGVTAGQPYVLENHFVVAVQTKSAGETFTGVYTDTDEVIVLMTNSSGGVVGSGTRITRGVIWKLGTREQ